MSRRCRMLPVIAAGIIALAVGLGGCTGGTASTSATASASGSIANTATASAPVSASASASASAPASASASASSSATASTGGLADSVKWFDSTKHSLTKDGSLWQIVNKSHPFQDRQFIPKDLVVTGVTNGKHLRADAAAALAKMQTASKRAGAPFVVVSAYRSYKYQVNLYNQYKAANGKASADRFSARPGYSEHQTGLATDLGSPDQQCTLQNCFGDTTAGKWLKKHSWQYGFILRFTKRQENTTGYMYEAWHFRYLGKSAAKAYHESGANTLEAFFGVTGGTTYKK